VRDSNKQTTNLEPIARCRTSGLPPQLQIFFVPDFEAIWWPFPSGAFFFTSVAMSSCHGFKTEKHYHDPHIFVSAAAASIKFAKFWLPLC
jgi:hypothetical protein